MSEKSPDYWGNLDPIYTELRRKLQADVSLRYGPNRVHEVARRVYGHLAQEKSIVGLRYGDIGCGCQHPFGTSTALYLNGLSFAVAMDAQETDTRRAAEALFDLLIDVMIEPARWHWSDLPRDRFMGNVQRFDLPALRRGDLEAGVAGVPLRHMICDLARSPLAAESLDLMSSQSVFEHFLDYKLVLRGLHELMAPGGRGYHLIDLSDHRRYPDPLRFNEWSFLTEEEEWSDGLCNRLRADEFVRELEEAGFRTEVVERHRRVFPRELRQHLKGRFARMSDEEIETTVVECLVAK